MDTTRQLFRLVRSLLPVNPAWVATRHDGYVLIAGPRDGGPLEMEISSEDQLRVSYPALVDAILAWEATQLQIAPALADHLNAQHITVLFPQGVSNVYVYGSSRFLSGTWCRLKQETVFADLPASVGIRGFSSVAVVAQRIEDDMAEGYELRLLVRPWTDEEYRRSREKLLAALPGNEPATNAEKE